MPRPGHQWRHIIINTKNTWLRGDARGFHSRTLELRSSGDYKNPPPPEEHRKLREYFQRVAGPEIRLDRKLRPIIGAAILAYLRELNFLILALAVGKVHAHGIVELPDDYSQVKRIIGHLKRKSSRAVKQWKPGSV